MTVSILSTFTDVWRYAWFLALRPLAILILTGAVVSVARSGLSICRDIPSMAYELFMWFTS
ncbi:hypothetical protein BO70DRAFT_428568 [Aspergillus heteromorphus CBS 117.55]|uniref:Uncharacterized protein n=1 Tax=Aspergillus heteromorphus CBS 117.55 TaxID=1448321 RepID=A0A317WIV1_9EURO|nr:uncharacterized protein BO70DRAFT_428568 [Aspergillus heteromorphus CBS 117.55]PWY84988.1 hypothetical protein BO70DRAFT_428568 [Aspergillus heteromorphus CBS 117.55]